MPAVDPTIAAAWITGGVGALGIVGTVVTSVVGSRNTKRATEATIAASAAATAATLAAAREERLWEKRAAAYEETIAELRLRMFLRSAVNEVPRPRPEKNVLVSPVRPGQNHGSA